MSDASIWAKASGCEPGKTRLTAPRNIGRQKLFQMVEIFRQMV